jgi:NIMA-interacting peptidyl-prolyl cis-trans isomerase 1
MYPSLVLLLVSALSACSPTSHAESRPSVIPVPPLPSEGSEVTGGIGVRAIFVAWKGAANASSEVQRTKQQAHERADMVANVAGMSGEHFTELVLKYSDRPPIKDGGGPGALLERGNGILPAKAEDAAFVLGVGQTSNPVETDQGYVIVQRTETPDGGPEQISARHILIAYKGAQRAAEDVTRTKDEARALASQVLTDVRAGKNWDELWKQYSNEPGGQEGGSLGVFGRGQMVPAFEKAAFSLKVGQIGEIVETPFGFHVIERTK